MDSTGNNLLNYVLQHTSMALTVNSYKLILLFFNLKKFTVLFILFFVRNMKKKSSNISLLMGFTYAKICIGLICMRVEKRSILD